MGNFFPPEYKQFPFKEGDVLACKNGSGKYALSKILRVDNFFYKKGSSISIQNKSFTAPAGRWTVRANHAPNRPPGAAEGQVLVGHAPVDVSELGGYSAWKRAFEKGEAGVF